MGLSDHFDSALWFLEATAGDPGAPRRISIAAVPFRVGRRADASLCLPDGAVSKLHAEIFVSNACLWLRDLGSTNGTFVNGNRVQAEVQLHEGDVIHFAGEGFRVCFRRASDTGETVRRVPGSDVLMLGQFRRLLEEPAAIPYFQSIVELNTGHTIGYEILARSEIDGLKTPYEMFTLAERLGLQGELSRLLRTLGTSAGEHSLGNANLFLNTHPSEIDQGELLQSLRVIREHTPLQPLTLEIHEAAVTDLSAMRELSAALKELKIGLAYDDFGAGQARLNDLVDVPPDYLKFDLILIRNIHASAQRQQMLKALVSMVRDLGIAALAEGIECVAEADTCAALGFQYAQGYYYGRPASLATLVTPDETKNSSMTQTPNNFQ